MEAGGGSRIVKAGDRVVYPVTGKKRVRWIPGQVTHVGDGVVSVWVKGQGETRVASTLVREA